MQRLFSQVRRSSPLDHARADGHAQVRRAPVLVADVDAEHVRVPPARKVDAPADERGDDHVEADDGGRVRDPERLREPGEVVGVRPPGLVELREARGWKGAP